MVEMDPGTRRLGWGWWALAFLALAFAVALGYILLSPRQSQPELIRVGMDDWDVMAILGSPGDYRKGQNGKRITVQNDGEWPGTPVGWFWDDRGAIVWFDESNRVTHAALWGFDERQ